MCNRFDFKARRSKLGHSGGFTLAEVIVAAGILAVFVSSSLIATTQMNRLAAVARLRTLAMAIAQQKIDAIATVSWGVASARPALLAAGTSTENNLPLDDDSFNNQSGLGSAFTSLDLRVSATRSTQITNVTTRTVSAVVTVTYVFRGSTYAVSLTTLRATDTI
jgi:type II secretory pathway pseudopilin PulG